MMSSYSVYRTKSAQGGGSSTDGVAASSTNTYYSEPWKGDVIHSGSVFTTGTLAGTWTLWVTDKNSPGLTNDTDWVDVSTHADFVETNPAGATTKWHWQSIVLHGGWFRLKYVNTSGTGNISAYVSRCGS